MAFTDAQYSFYEYVKPRLLSYIANPANNPTSVSGVSSITVSGILNAQDWPSKTIKFDSFYLLVLGEEPIGKQGYSQYSPMVFHQLQWVWIDKGSDTVAGQRQANRGDRFVLAQVMKGALLYGHAPGYAPKLTWALVNGVFTGSPTSTPNEAITWNPLTFREKYDKASGLIYGAAQVRVWDMTDAITS